MTALDYTPPAPKPRRFYAWELLGLLWIAMFLNQGDRQIFNAVLPLIRADLHATDVQLGWVAGGFTLAYGLLVPFAGVLGDVASRKWTVVLSLLVFSTGTLCTGLSGGLIGLLLFRSLATGVGEALYYPAAASLLAQQHPRHQAQAFAIHQTANYLGVVLSSWAMASIGERYGWRVGFYVFGVLGVILAIVMSLRIDDARDATPAATGEAPPPAPATAAESIRFVVTRPTFYVLTLAFCGMVFVNVGYLTWMPTYLHERFQLSLPRAALQAVLLHYLFAFVGLTLAGRFSDTRAGRRPAIRAETCMVGLLLGAPFILLLGVSPRLVIVYAALAGFGFCRGIYDSNISTALFTVVPPRYRATSVGLMLAVAFVVGASAPVVLAYLKQRIGLGTALASLSGVYLASGLCILVGRALFFDADRSNAEDLEAMA